MEIERLSCFSMTVGDRPGKLATFVRQIAKQEVSLLGLWTFSIGEGKAWIITVPKDPELFKKVAQALSIECAEGACYRISGDDRLGVLSTILDAIAEKDLNIHALDAVAVDGKFGCYVWSENNEIEELGEVLGLSS